MHEYTVILIRALRITFLCTCMYFTVYCINDKCTTVSTTYWVTVYQGRHLTLWHVARGLTYVARTWHGDTVARDAKFSLLTLYHSLSSFLSYFSPCLTFTCWPVTVLLTVNNNCCQLPLQVPVLLNYNVNSYNGHTHHHVQ